MTNETSIITVVNSKGGAGKTTTAVNLGAALTNLGKRVLIIDADRQGNSTRLLGADEKAQTEHKFLSSAITMELPLEQVKVASAFPGIDVVAPGKDLYEVRDKMAADPLNHLLFSSLFESDALRQYDCVFVDTHPSWSCIVVSALTLSHYFLIPAFPEPESIQGILDLLGDVNRYLRKLNPTLTNLGVLISKYNRNNATHKRYEPMIRQLGVQAKFPVLSTIIPESNSVQAASSAKIPLLKYRPDSLISNAYKLVAKELLPQLKGRRVERPTQHYMEVIVAASQALNLEIADEL
jgi:chromosome partitioning protein